MAPDASWLASGSVFIISIHISATEMILILDMTTLRQLHTISRCKCRWMYACVVDGCMCACGQVRVCERASHLTYLRHPQCLEVLYEGSLINKILGEFFQGNQRIHSTPNAVDNFSQPFKHLPLNFNIAAFLDDIP